MRALANGTNPENGETLEASSVYRQPPDSTSAESGDFSPGCGAREPRNAFRTWTRAENVQVYEEVRKGMDSRDVAKAHDRTVPS